jgi:hypothetical protein
MKLSRFLLLCLAVTCMLQTSLAQNEPEAPRRPEKIYNGFQFSLFTGTSANVLKGGYIGTCPCEFVSSASSWGVPYGFSLNIPVGPDAALYLRAGVQNTATDFFSGRVDSLRSVKDASSIGSDLRITFNLVQLDFLLRLIGRQDGERVFFGLGVGYVQKKHVYLTDTEYQTGAVYTIENGELQDPRKMFTWFIIGGEYAFIPVKNLYVIPSLEIDYGLQKILKESTPRPTFTMRPIFYKLLLTVSYQIF